MTASDRTGLNLNRKDPFSGMVKISAGTFRMGTPEGFDDHMYNDAPGHEVMISRDYWIGRYPVTERFYAETMGKEWDPETADLPKRFGAGNADDFLNALNEIFKDRLPDGYQFNLPTEAQWEYAAKAGSGGLLPNPAGSEIDPAKEKQQLEEYGKNVYRDTPDPVWKYPANAWGLCGIPGGIHEYCRDLYDDYPSGPATDPEGPAGQTGSMSGIYRVVRGPNCVYRNTEWTLRVHFKGFRLVIAVVNGPKTEEAENWKRQKASYDSRARSFFQTLYPDRDIKPLLVDIASDDEFAEYMEFAEQIKDQNFPYEKAEYAIQNGLDLATLNALVFYKDMAEEAAKHWDKEHGTGTGN